MKSAPLDCNLTLAGFLTLVKAAFVGFFVGEVWYFAQFIGNVLYRYVDSRGIQFATLILSALSLLLIVAYLLVRRCHTDAIRILRSYRIDILATLLLGLAISVSFDGLGSPQYAALANLLRPVQALLLALTPLVIGLLLVLRGLTATSFRTSERAPPFFISDAELTSAKDDLLDFSDSATRFAERALNSGAPDSLVFGIDAPWGIGKSTFVNLCIEYWEEKHQDSVIVYKFDLLRFEQSANVLESFVDGLVRVIQSHLFIPEIRPLVSQYSRFIRGKAGFSRFGLNLEIAPRTYTVDDAFEDLQSALARIHRKIIIIVDDLDRISFEAVKRVLFAIKKSFTLPNISYVLCYDTENIIATGETDSDADQVREFLEKFVNVKISLFVGGNSLSRYVSQNFAEAVQNNLQLDPRTLDQIRQAIDELEKIYNSSDFHLYQSLIGDVRKLKRLINTLVLFEIEKTDFENSDLNKRDLINLLLIYINFPAVFRKIYSTEAEGKRGFFSLLTEYDNDYPLQAGQQDAFGQPGGSRYKNSKKYSTYVEGLTSDNQKAVLERLFSASQRLGEARVDEVTEEQLRSCACFNGGRDGIESRNLEAYLNLIVRLSKPRKRDQYRFYVNAKNQLLAGTAIDDLLSAAEFSFEDGEDSREQFWRIVVNSAEEFAGARAPSIITYLMDHFPDYSTLSLGNLGDGLRDNLSYFLTKLLDSIGWSTIGGGRANTAANIAEIADWIFGRNRHHENGVLQKLGDVTRGPLGLFDLMLFRLYCCADRGGRTFNLQRALALDANPNAQTTGALSAIVVGEMRVLSQVIFRLVNSQYITSGRNIFELIQQLTIEDLAGKYKPFIDRKVQSGEITERDRDRAVARAKTRVTGFIAYQLGNTIVSSGIGCGYYDEAGTNDNRGISNAINEYLFGRCFDPCYGEKNFEYFLDYLLINFVHTFDDSEHPYKPHIDAFTKVLDRHRLEKYWRTNRVAIRALDFPSKDKEIVTANYIANYGDDLADVYRVLDELAPI